MKIHPENAIYNKGKVIDLVFPILSLIVCCVIGMIYSGGFFSGTGFVEAFSESDASVGLMLGSFFAMVITIVFYVVRKVLRFSDSMACIPEGFKAMVPAILILTFAWTLKAMTDSLGAAPYRSFCNEFSSRRIDEPSSSNHLPCRMFPCICNRYFLGNIRNSDSNCSCSIPGYERDNDDHLNLSLYGRSSLRRSLFTYFRYNNHGIRRSAV